MSVTSRAASPAFVVQAADRHRLGIIKPTRRTRSDYWRAHLPDSIDIDYRYLEFQRGDPSTFDAAFPAAERLAAELRDAGCELVVIGGTPPFLLKGAAFEARWSRELSSRLGIAVVTPMATHVEAIRAVGVDRSLVASYYGAELAGLIGTYLAACGITPIVAPGFSLSGDSEGLYSTALAALDDVTSRQVEDYCLHIASAATAEFDGLYVNGAGWDAEPAIEPLAQRLRLPVVWGQAAELDAVLSVLGLDGAPG